MVELIVGILAITIIALVWCINKVCDLAYRERRELYTRIQGTYYDDNIKQDVKVVDIPNSSDIILKLPDHVKVDADGVMIDTKNNIAFESMDDYDHYVQTIGGQDRALTNYEKEELLVRNRNGN